MKDFTCDAFLGGKIQVQQPRIGFRAGADSVFLAASARIKPGQALMDLGCGAGAVLKAIQHRIPGAVLYGIEKNPEMCGYARRNSETPDLKNGWALFEEDLFSVTKSAALAPLQQTLDAVTMNPPYYDGVTHTASENKTRAEARTYEDLTLGLDAWFKAAAFLLKDKGEVTLIYPVQALDSVVKAAQKAHFGALTLFPLWPKKGVPAKRMLVRFKKNSKRPCEMHPGLVLHEEDGRPTPEAERVLKDGEALVF